MNRKINANMRRIQLTRTRQRILFGIILLLLASICGVWSQTTSAVPPPSGTSAGTIRTEDLGNGVTLEMIAIPGGNFMMGSSDSEKDRKKDEGPQHSVTLAPFWIGKYEVTQAQWQAVMGSNPSRNKGDNMPVENISWNDARNFCQKLSSITGKQYRLPSEAEWEYACRAGTSTRYFFGDADSAVGDYAWFFYNSGRKSHPVGEKSPNPWGLYDIYGNVMEWCGDIYHDSYAGAPCDGSAWISGGDGFQVLRGSYWLNGAKECRSARRIRHKPDFFDINVGFRIVVSGKNLNEQAENPAPKTENITQKPGDNATSASSAAKKISVVAFIVEDNSNMKKLYPACGEDVENSLIKLLSPFKEFSATKLQSLNPSFQILDQLKLRSNFKYDKEPIPGLTKCGDLIMAAFIKEIKFGTRNHFFGQTTGLFTLKIQTKIINGLDGKVLWENVSEKTEEGEMDNLFNHTATAQGYHKVAENILKEQVEKLKIEKLIPNKQSGKLFEELKKEVSLYIEMSNVNT